MFSGRELPMVNAPNVARGGPTMARRCYLHNRLIVLTAWLGPRQPRNLSRLSSSALVDRKNCSSRKHARGGVGYP